MQNIEKNRTNKKLEMSKGYYHTLLRVCCLILVVIEQTVNGTPASSSSSSVHQLGSTATATNALPTDVTGHEGIVRD